MLQRLKLFSTQFIFYFLVYFQYIERQYSWSHSHLRYDFRYVQQTLFYDLLSVKNVIAQADFSLKY